MKKYYILAVTAISVLLADCGSKKAITSSKTPEATVAEVKKNYTPAELEEGKTTWQTSCNKCHKLYPAGDYTVEKWESILPRMIKRSKLADDQAGKVHAYLIANAKK